MSLIFLRCNPKEEFLGERKLILLLKELCTHTRYQSTPARACTSSPSRNPGTNSVLLFLNFTFPYSISLSSFSYFNIPLSPSLVKYGVRSPKFIWALCAQLYSLAETPQLPPLSPRLWTHLRGRYWSAKIDDISLVTP
jgi:hypothetical protein